MPLQCLQIFLLWLSGVQSWYSLTYSSTKVCGLKGASVVLPCSHEFSGIGHYVSGEWYREPGRVWKYNNPKYPDCSLKIVKLSHDCSGLYVFRFYTTLHLSWITGHSGVTLSVTELQVKEEALVGNQNQTKVTCSTTCSLGSQYVWYKNGEHQLDKTTAFILLDATRPSEVAYYSCAVNSFYQRSAAVCAPEKHCWLIRCLSSKGEQSKVDPQPKDKDKDLKSMVLQVTMTSEPVIEGGNVTLTCSSICTLGNDLTFIWYKNRQQVSDKQTSTDNKLHLNPVSSEDGGNYSCAVKGYMNVVSNTVSVVVKYVPRNVSVLISASSEMQEGSSVTLTCSSDANPPVHTYTWYMKSEAESLVRSTEESISFSVTSETSGLYYCEAQNEVGSQNSTNVMIVAKSATAAVMMIQTGITLLATLIIALVFASLWLRTKRKTILCSSPYTLEADSSDVYANIVATTDISNPGQRGDPKEEDVHYASIQFRPHTAVQESLYINVQEVQQLKQDKDIVYASVRPNQP